MDQNSAGRVLSDFTLSFHVHNIYCILWDECKFAKRSKQRIIDEFKQRFIIIMNLTMFRNNLSQYQKQKRTSKNLLKNGVRTPVLNSASFVTSEVSSFLTPRAII
jgi:hypothetical protein